jgi:hypothetical protein
MAGTKDLLRKGENYLGDWLRAMRGDIAGDVCAKCFQELSRNQRFVPDPQAFDLRDREHVARGGGHKYSVGVLQIRRAEVALTNGDAIDTDRLQ